MTYEKKRAHITDNEERLIKLYANSPLYLDMGRPELADKMLTWIKWPGKPPEREVLEKKITKYRSEGDGWDDPWSLGESMKPEYHIPHDATGILLELYQYSLEIGYPLTLRHARWIARLHRVIVTAAAAADRWQQIQVLFFTALEYADLEQVSQPPEVTVFDTRAEDAELVLPQDEVAILRASGILPFRRIIGIPKRQEKRDRAAGIGRSARTNIYEMVRSGDFNLVRIVHYLHYPRSLDQLPRPQDSEASEAFFRSWVGIEDIVAGLSIEQQRGYAILLSCFSKGSGWNGLSPEDFTEIISKLVQLVSERSTLAEILHSFIFDSGTTFAPYLEKVGLPSPLDNILSTMLGLPEDDTD